MESRQISVETTSNGLIRITQEDPIGNHDDTIEITPDQVFQLIAWLRDARQSIDKGE